MSNKAAFYIYDDFAVAAELAFALAKLKIPHAMYTYDLINATQDRKFCSSCNEKHSLCICYDEPDNSWYFRDLRDSYQTEE